MATLHSFTLAGPIGTEAQPVTVTVTATKARDGEAPTFQVLGVSAVQAKELAVRVRSALTSLGVDAGVRAYDSRVTVKVDAPVGAKVQASNLDLPIALAIVREDFPADLLVAGELGLDGSVRGVRGVLAAVEMAKSLGMRGVLVPTANVEEALIVEWMEVFGISHIREVSTALSCGDVQTAPEPRKRKPSGIDFSEVRGQEQAIGSVVAAVTRHLKRDERGSGLLLSGPPGVGKTMIARRIPSIFPTMTRDQALEVTKVYSALGLADRLVTERPFRAPHYTISQAALVGGGYGTKRPGELHMAMHGVLLLDEVTEFSRGTIEALAVALREMPAESRPMIVAAANPCPCGWLVPYPMPNVRECTCSPASLKRYQERLDTVRGHLNLSTTATVRSVGLAELRSEEPSESSESLRARVASAVGAWS